MKRVMMLTTTAYMSERFNRENILILENMGYEVYVAANFDKGNPIDKEILDEFKSWIESHHGKWIQIPLTRSPKDLKGLSKSKEILVKLIKDEGIELIHCHTPMGGALGRIVAHATKTKVIYTAHGFHFFSGAPMLNWLIYYPVEKMLSKWTDILITINQEDFKRAKAKFKAKKIEYIPGVGIDSKKYSSHVDNIQLHSKLCNELYLTENSKLLLSVGELNDNKNHQVVINAISKIELKDDIHYLICGKENQKNQKKKLEQLAKDLNVLERVHFLGYRTDVDLLCKAADVFVFPSKREGLSVALMEAVASGMKIVASGARGNRELLLDGQNGFLCPGNSVEEYVQAINKCLELDTNLVKHVDNSIIVNFDRENVNQHMLNIYRDILNE